jgi:hypothetical protein
MARNTISLKDAGLKPYIIYVIVAFGLLGAGVAWKMHHSTPRLHAASLALLPLAHHDLNPEQEFPESFPLQVAVFWMPTEEGPKTPLALVHVLKEMGIPFFITRNLNQALKHRMVILYPEVGPTTFSEADAQQLLAFVKQGGNIFAQNVYWGGLKPLFGFRDFTASRKRHRLVFTSTSDFVMKYLNRPEEREISLGSPNVPEVIWTNGYTAEAGTEVLARFEDGTAALFSNALGKGKAYLLGMSLVDAVLRCQSNRDFEAQRHYVNEFEPGADVWLLVIRAWYEGYAKDWVRLATIPDGQRSVVLLSHDVDWEDSFKPGLDFVRMEKANRASSTFFIQTKYVDDANSKAFFFDPDLTFLRELKEQGASIGSHSIIHSRGFNKFDLGTGQETYSTYQPRGLGFDTASGATVFGEVRVSKELLDGEIPGQQTIFFRAGHLRVPRSLAEALVRSGYEFDSSFTADDVLSNFPYALPLDLGFEEDSGIYEFPVTIEDEEPPGYARRVPQALEVIRANAENGAISVVLVHSNESKTKAAAEDEMLRQLPPDIGKTDMLSFAKFWRARDGLQWGVISASSATADLQITSQEPVAGLTFEFQRRVASVSGGATVSADQRRIVLPALTPGQTISLHVTYHP